MQAADPALFAQIKEARIPAERVSSVSRGLGRSWMFRDLVVGLGDQAVRRQCGRQSPDWLLASRMK